MAALWEAHTLYLGLPSSERRWEKGPMFVAVAVAVAVAPLLMVGQSCETIIIKIIIKTKFTPPHTCR